MTSPSIAQEPNSASTPAQGPLTAGEILIQRIRLLCALAVAAVIFWYFGWWAASSVDPEGPVSLLMVDQGVITMAELLGLAVVTSGLAVAICGAGSADRGPLAVAVGLAALGLRGAQMDSLVLYRLTTTSPNQTLLDPYPAWSLIAETWLWLALIGVGLVVGRWVESWFLPEQPGASATSVRPPIDFKQGVGTLAVAFFLSLGIASFTLGDGELPILKGQVYFGLIIAFLIGTLTAHWLFQTATPVWALCTVALVATVAYTYGRPDQGVLDAARQAGSYVALDDLARPLPIEYAALGGIGALFESNMMNFIAVLFGLQTPRNRIETPA